MEVEMLHKILLSIFLITFNPSVFASNVEALSNNKWNYLSSVPNSKIIEINPAVSLKISSPSQCCKGVITTKISEEIIKHYKEPAILFPAIGGLSRLEVNNTIFDRELFGASDAILIPLTETIIQSTPAIEIRVSLDGVPWSFYQGFWKGIPVIGDTQELIAMRDRLHQQQTYIPTINIIYLLFGAVISFGFYYATNRRLKYYRNSGIIFISSTAFYLSLTGWTLDLN
ncbi:MAG: hypothetical protein H7235_07595, partial [Bdellovibrionaceae bacterium]|nr:hypothetical protein [Pseudobdellovibrionaceae bacterium]